MKSLQRAAESVRRGEVVAFPTESFYALGADATNPAAVRRVFELKRRERKPIALIAGNWQQVEKFFTMTKAERGIARKHWPGALTVLLKPKDFTTPNPSFPRQSSGQAGRRGGIAADAFFETTPPGRMTGHPSSPDLSSRGRRGILVGVRMPAHAQARELALTAGVPLTATSANISGRAPTKSAAKVKRDFPGILTVAGRCGKQRLPSTVIEVFRNRVRMVRHGSVRINDHV